MKYKTIDTESGTQMLNESSLQQFARLYTTIEDNNNYLFETEYIETDEYEQLYYVREIMDLMDSKFKNQTPAMMKKYLQNMITIFQLVESYKNRTLDLHNVYETLVAIIYNSKLQDEFSYMDELKSDMKYQETNKAEWMKGTQND